MTSAVVDIAGLAFQRPASRNGGERGKDEQGFRLEAPHFAVRSGDQIALVGPSGSGKTTLLRLLSLTLKPAQAERFVVQPDDAAAVDVARAWARGDHRTLDKLRARFLGMARHAGEVAPFLSAREAVAVRMELAHHSDRNARGQEVLGAVGLAELALRKPARLSQGQRQRLGIASALSHAPRLLMADEPTAALDAANGEQVMRILAEAAHGEAAVVIATHDPDLAARHGFTILPAETTRDGHGMALNRFSTVAG